MKSSIIFCHTPFQCITALLLKMQNLDFDNEKTTLVVVDDFSNADRVYERFTELGLFDEVLFGDYKKLNNKIKFFVSIVFPKVFEKVTGFENNQYTDLYTNNVYGDFENFVLAYNKNIAVHLYDEGYSSYLAEYLNGFYKYSPMHELAYSISKLLFRRKLVFDTYSDLYLYDDRLLTYKIFIPVKKIVLPMEFELFIKYVNYIFNLDGDLDLYSRHFIMFEESFFIGKESMADVEAFEWISEIIGKDNLLVKLHPRDIKDRFRERGICTNKHSEVPWEAVVLGMSIKNKVFITFSSGAAINYLFFGLNGYKTIFLYDVFPEMGEMTESKRKWFSLFEKYYGENVFIPNTKKELIELLQNI